MAVWCGVMEGRGGINGHSNEYLKKWLVGCILGEQHKLMKLCMNNTTNVTDVLCRLTVIITMHAPAT